MAAGLGIKVLCGHAQRYIDQLEATIAQGGTGIISIGIAGGLAPGLAPGDWVVASAAWSSAANAIPPTAAGLAAFSAPFQVRCSPTSPAWMRP